jgi:hypothetical protein
MFGLITTRSSRGVISAALKITEFWISTIKMKRKKSLALLASGE